MSLVLDHPHLTDTLRYRVYAHRQASQDQVRITVEVIALVAAADRDQKTLDGRIRDALRTFIDSDWTLTRIERTSDATGYERVTLSAGARVPASENYDLANRARLASRDGLALARPAASYALSRTRLDAILGELMTEVLGKIASQAKAFTESTGRTWRIGDVEFGVTDMSSSASRSPKGAYRVEDIADLLPLPEDDLPDETAMAGSERLWIMAAVTLKSAPG